MERSPHSAASSFTGVQDDASVTRRLEQTTIICFMGETATRVIRVSGLVGPCRPASVRKRRQANDIPSQNVTKASELAMAVHSDAVAETLRQTGRAR